MKKTTVCWGVDQPQSQNAGTEWFRAGVKIKVPMVLQGLSSVPTPTSPLAGAFRALFPTPYTCLRTALLG
jgi:hypothetical protein